LNKSAAGSQTGVKKVEIFSYFLQKKLAVLGIFYKTTKADVFFGEKLLLFTVDNE
jgi:hypothetical protein